MLRIRIKTKEKASEQYKITLRQFFIEYFNAFFCDLNNILADYHSIQEHACRNKIIEFSFKKLKDLHLLQILVKGAFLQRNLQLNTFIGDDYMSSSIRIVEMADFLALLFENMKTSFIPMPNFSLALQAYIDYKKLLPTQQLHPNIACTSNLLPTEMSSEDFNIIHRMMKIYLIKEDIPDFEIKNGILFIKSEFFTFELALCGDFFNPQWQLYNVQSRLNSKLIENQILKRVNAIPVIVKFIRFYENRKNVVGIFNKTDNRTGFYQNFTGTIANAEIHGYFKDFDFYCVFDDGNLKTSLKNPSTDDINKLIDTKVSLESKIIVPDDAKNDTFEFKREIFGPNETWFRSNMFFSLSKTGNVCFFGEVSPVCGIKYTKINLYSIGGILMGICGSFSTSDQIKEFILQFKIDPDSVMLSDAPVSSECFLDFLSGNTVFLAVAYALRSSNTKLLIYRSSLYSSIFTLDSKLDMRMSEDEHNIESLVPILSRSSDYLQSLREYFSKKIDLIRIQNNVPLKCNVIEKIIGKKISLLVYDIKVTISDKIETDIPSLTHDCKFFNIEKGFEYILNFGVFYKFNLFPTYHTERKIIFKFSNFVEENVEVCQGENCFLIKGPKTLAITKIPNTFTSKDWKCFIILHKFFLADRFIYLKNVLHSYDSCTNSNEIHLKNNRRILLTQEGIKFQNSDSNVDKEITDVLNSKRDIEIYIQEKIIK